jgi:hypothetical protein
MPYCSLEEAWAPVSYKNSDVYKKDGNSIYPEQCPEEPTPVQKSFSRTNERLGKHSGPINRIPEYKNQVVKFNQNNERYMAEPELSNVPNYNYDNNETPLTSYDRNYFEKNETPNAPIHKIAMKKKQTTTNKKKDMDSIDKIIADVEDNISDEDEPHDVNKSYKELSIEHDDKNDLIKHLIGQNEKLKSMLKKIDKKSSSSGGVFNVFDFVIVLLLGIIMLIILDYIHRIVVKRLT